MYSQQLDEQCMEKIAMLTELRNKVAQFRNCVTEEETMSKKMTNSATPRR